MCSTLRRILGPSDRGYVDFRAALYCTVAAVAVTGAVAVALAVALAVLPGSKGAVRYVAKVEAGGLVL